MSKKSEKKYMSSIGVRAREIGHVGQSINEGMFRAGECIKHNTVFATAGMTHGMEKAGNKLKNLFAR